MANLDRLGWAAGVAFDCYGARVGIRANDAAVLKRLLPRVPPGWIPSTALTVDHLYSLISGHDEPGASVRHYNVFYSGLTQLVRTMDLNAALETLESTLRFDTAVFAREKLFVHAGVVGWQDQAIVIPGQSSSRSSTLVAALVRAGATYYSDEFAVFDAAGWVHPYPRSISLRGGEPGCERKYVFDEAGSSPGTEPLRAGLIVVAECRAGARWRPQKMTPGQATLALLNNTVLAHTRAIEALSIFRQVTSDAMAITGTRGETHELTRSLLETVGLASI